MEGKEAIINKIKEDASKKSSSIIDKARFDGNLLIKDSEVWAEKYLSAQKEILKKEQGDIISRRKTVADLDVRKILLQKKQDLISEIIDAVFVKMTKLDKKEYASICEKNISVFADDGDEIILSNDGVLKKEDVESFKIFKEKRLSVSEKKGNFLGGVYLVGKVSDKDLSFRSLIDSNKEKIISDIAEKLF